MSGELARLRACYASGVRNPAMSVADVQAMASCAEAAIDYIDLEAAMSELKGCTVAQKNTLRLAYMNLKLRADGLR